MLDNCSVPIGDVTSASFSVNPGETKTIQVISDIIPSYAYVGLASATVILVDSSLGPINFETISFYIHAFSSITVAPSTTSITAGNNISYTATAYDSNFNKVDITSWVAWSTNSDAGGSWLENQYTSAKAGVWNVTATLGSLAGTTTTNVTHASANKIIILSQNQAFLAGQSQPFTTTGYDIYNNSWNLTSSTVWSISSNAGGSWVSNIYTSAKAGIWTVTGTYMNLQSVTPLTVTHNTAANVTISPKNIILSAGTSQSYNVSAVDSYGNSWDVSNSIIYAINSSAGGSWLNNTYTCSKAGVWTITSTLGSISDQSSLIVSHGSINSIDISPNSANLTAGFSQNFNSTASDLFGNKWDATNITAFSINSTAMGSWTGNTYTSQASGDWIVTGSSSNVSNSAYLDVSHGSLVKVVIGSPPSVDSGDLVSFYATAFDSFGNSWDITSLVNWSISSGAGGSWLGNSYTSANVGNWTVTAAYSGVQGSIQSTNGNLVVQYSPIDFYHQGTVNFRDLAYFESAYVQFAQTGILNPACDLNHDGQINFIDLELFTADYIAYYEAVG